MTKAICLNCTTAFCWPPLLMCEMATLMTFTDIENRKGTWKSHGKCTLTLISAYYVCRYRWVCQRCPHLPQVCFMYKHCRVLQLLLQPPIHRRWKNVQASCIWWVVPIHAIKYLKVLRYSILSYLYFLPIKSELITLPFCGSISSEKKRYTHSHTKKCQISATKTGRYINREF